jgi:gamma-glutamylcyclotransferase (GGCT)/AIG2-like uncharacterized protein YtfP
VTTKAVQTRTTHRVFVYGTLKRGHGNWFHFLKDDAAFVGHAITVKEFSMIAGGFPVVLDCDGNRGQIKGEVYDVNDKTLSALDGLEGFRGEGDPTNMYDRKLTDVQIWDGKALITEAVGIYIGSHRFAGDRRHGSYWDVRNSSGQLEWPRATS